MGKVKTEILLLLMCSLCVWAGEAIAGGISFNHNRMVYKEGTSSESITARNSSDKLYLLQSGVITSPDGNTPGPFWVTPPIVRLESNSTNVLRIVGRPELLATLPHDRESVFYFFGNAIPSQPDGGTGKNTAQLSIGIKTVLKLFWRPKNLTGDPDRVFSDIKVIRKGDRVVFTNPTPYFASFAELTIDGHAADLSQQPSMIPPYSEVSFSSGGRAGQVSWRLMTDYGGVTDKRNVQLKEEGK